ncbi:hypothetical protein AURDEDRAFT_111699 [Auricularia subglabra TFB-10046 SS5]|nr:hypothetical protein AURDEDRAFT_111699 [Auricularia subglabra TFB-10046 SS5]
MPSNGSLECTASGNLAISFTFSDSKSMPRRFLSSPTRLAALRRFASKNCLWYTLPFASSSPFCSSQSTCWPRFTITRQSGHLDLRCLRHCPMSPRTTGHPQRTHPETPWQSCRWSAALSSRTRSRMP